MRHSPTGSFSLQLGKSGAWADALQGFPHQHSILAEAESEGHRDLGGAPSGSRALDSTRPPASTRRGSHVPRRRLHADCRSAQSLANTASPPENGGPEKQAGPARVHELPSQAGDAWQATPDTMRPGPGRAQPRTDNCALRPQSGRRTPHSPARPKRPASRRYLQVPASRLQDETSPFLLSARHRHELPQRLLLLRRHLCPVHFPNRSGGHCNRPNPRSAFRPPFYRVRAGRLAIGPAQCGATGKVLLAGNPSASRPLVAPI